MKVILANRVTERTFITTANVLLLSHNGNPGWRREWVGSSILVTANFFNFTVNFLGNYWFI